MSELTDKPLALPINERILLAGQLWDSIEGVLEPEIEEVWLNEAEKRWREIEEGKVQCIPAEEAMKKARNSLK